MDIRNLRELRNDEFDRLYSAVVEEKNRRNAARILAIEDEFKQLAKEYVNLTGNQVQININDTAIVKTNN